MRPIIHAHANTCKKTPCDKTPCDKNPCDKTPCDKTPCDKLPRVRLIRNIGLLGGSFDPPHQGHIAMSLLAKKHFGLHEIWWLIMPTNPLKHQPDGLTDLSVRIKQCQELLGIEHDYAIGKNIRLMPATKIIKTPQPYVYYLLRQIQQNPMGLTKRAVQWFFLMGSDCWREFHLWHQYQKITTLMPLIIFNRQPHPYRHEKTKAGIRLQTARPLQPIANVDCHFDWHVGRPIGCHVGGHLIYRPTTPKILRFNHPLNSLSSTELRQK